MELPDEKSNRIAWLDALKGFAILCVIIGHIIERMETGIGSVNVLLHFINYFLNGMHIYVFFMVSGFLYAESERKKLMESQSYSVTFIKKKFFDLMVPYLIFAVLVYIGKIIFAQFVVVQVSALDLLLIFIRPVAFLWFIYVLFIIYMLVLLIEKLSLFDNKPLMIVAIAFIILYLVFNPNNVLIRKTLCDFLFFVVGILICDHKKVLDNKGIWIVSSIVTVVFSFICYFYGKNEIIILDVLYVIESVASSFFFFQTFYMLKNYKFKVLDKFGNESLYLYIIHPVVLNFVRMIFILLGYKNSTIWLICLFITGVGIPYLYSVLAKRWALFEIWFKPRKYIEKILKKKKSC